ncbi:uncharacterized protein LOC118433126 isoform X2 [Folsomia candida]|uniref:Cilia- and flagella-associated protein 126 n=1 Tax=Folsomia candida TaxID=158441 RepID=A0A226D2A2_FOLCA|nr:uncharacterized protein LOC118433126 isoform X2 [Folsomia candida]OXA38948.1 Protein Flattop [Folsomia candida]
MSGFYTASQFDHAFKPTKLRNWEYGTNPWPGKYAICSPIRCDKTEFIACDNGHLFPCVPRNGCTSPWGDYATWIWEQTKPCCCIRQLRHPEQLKPPRLIYVTNEIPRPGKFASDAAKEFNCAETKEGMMDDVASGRDPCCPGQKRPGPYVQVMGRQMVGDRAAMRKQMMKERRALKRSVMSKRGARCPDVITFRFSMGCPPDLCQPCKKPAWRK